MDDSLHDLSETIRATVDAERLMASQRAHKGIWAQSEGHLHPDLVPNANFIKDIYDHDIFEARRSSTKKSVEICRLGMGRASSQYVYSVPLARANKALKLLHPAHLQASLRTPCGCRHACNTKFSEADLIRKRVWYLQNANELDARSGLLKLLSADAHSTHHPRSFGFRPASASQQKDTEDRLSRQQRVRLPQFVSLHKLVSISQGIGWGRSHRSVCEFLHAFTRDSRHQALCRSCRRPLWKSPLCSWEQRPTPQHEGGISRALACLPVLQQGLKAHRIRAFWRSYFPRISQVVRNGEKTLPNGTVIKLIYQNVFIKWWRTGNYVDPETNEPIEAPALTTFLRQSKHHSFGHVNRKPKHTHLRCDLCAKLRIKNRKGFENDEDTEAYQQAYMAHQVDIDEWRDVEAFWKSEGVHEPFKNLVLMADDTSSVGFPWFTRRNLKGLSTTPRVHFVPWLFENYSTNEQVYVYSLKKKFRKGGNRFSRSQTCSTHVVSHCRWCSMLHGIVRAVKERDHKAASAKHLVFMGNDCSIAPSHSPQLCLADNYNENKNNTDLAWATQLVSEGWYESVQFLYGPVGHTHSAIDATHNVHNVVASRLALAFELTPCCTVCWWVHEWHPRGVD
jgi:hypothetical protein